MLPAVLVWHGSLSSYNVLPSASVSVSRVRAVPPMTLLSFLQLNINIGNGCLDCLAAYCCTPCAVAQHRLEILESAAKEEVPSETDAVTGGNAYTNAQQPMAYAPQPPTSAVQAPAMTETPMRQKPMPLAPQSAITNDGASDSQANGLYRPAPATLDAIFAPPPAKSKKL